MEHVSKPLLLRHIRHLASGADAEQVSDGDLLRRFATECDEDAFAELVRRHGPLVLNTCRRVLAEPAEIDDAFQATFLVLARKATAVCGLETAAGFLYGVAHNVSLRARDTARRRAHYERQVPTRSAPDPLEELSVRELLGILDEELARLPEKYRTPLVLCHLEGTTRDEAARRLGCSVAALKGRLERGKDHLRGALKRRGVMLPATLASLLVMKTPVPAALTERTCRLVLPLAAGSQAAEGSQVAWLAAEALRLPSAKLKAVAGLLLGAAVLAAGVGWVGSDRPAADPPMPPATLVPVSHADAWGDPLPEGAIARLGTMRFNHGDGLSTLHFTSDGKTIVSVGKGMVRRWDAATGRELGQFAADKGTFDDEAVLAADGKTLTILSQDSSSGDTLRVWDLARGTCVRTLSLPLRRNEWSVDRRNALSPDGRLCAIHTPEEISVFDATTGKARCKLAKGGKDVRCVVFAGNDKLVSADSKQVIDLWESRTGIHIRSFAHRAPAEVLVASADGRRLVVLEHHTHAIDRFLERDVVHVWDLATATRLHTLAERPRSWVMRTQFSPDAKSLFVASCRQDNRGLNVWDLETGSRKQELTAVAQIMTVSPDGNRLAGGALPGKFDVWDLKTGGPLSSEVGRHARAAAVFLSHEGERASVVGFTSISSWDGLTGRLLHSFELPAFNYTDPHRSFSPDGRLAVSFAGEWNDRAMCVWDVLAGKRRHTLRVPGQMAGVQTTFSPNSALLATMHGGKPNRVRLWDMGSGKEVGSFPEEKSGWTHGMYFSPDGKTLFVVGAQVVGYEVYSGKELFCWRPQRVPDTSGVKVAVIGGPPVDEDSVPAWRGSVISPNGNRVAGILSSGFGRERLADRIVLYDARTGRVLRRCNDSGKPTSGYEELAFSPDGRLLATSDGYTVRLWEEATATEVASFRGHRGEICSLVFSGNGRRLASASWDSTILIWDIAKVAAGPSLEQCWRDLAGEDAARAWKAIWTLARMPAACVPFLAERLRPAPAVSRDELQRLIAELDNDDFASRSRSTRALEKLGRRAGPALQRALGGKPTPEARRRMQELQRQIDEEVVAGEALLGIRAVAALEHIGTPPARQLLEALASGAEGALLTEEAKAALARAPRR
jgi:RNA polymerase sigma factor (sigma-70 family)